MIKFGQRKEVLHRSKTKEFRAQVRDVMGGLRIHETTLILDGTGPMISGHYPLLCELELDALKNFKEVLCYSGGLFSYMFFFAWKNDQLKLKLSTIGSEIDSKIRQFHNYNSVNLLQIARNLVFGNPIFEGEAVLIKLLHFLFKEEFLSTSLADLPSNLKPVFGNSTDRKIAVMGGAEKRKLTIERSIIQACLIPRIYTSAIPIGYFDPVYAQNYKEHIQQCVRASNSVILSSPKKEWHKILPNARILGLPIESSPVDAFLRLMFNISNEKYSSGLKILEEY